MKKDQRELLEIQEKALGVIRQISNLLADPEQINNLHRLEDLASSAMNVARRARSMHVRKNVEKTEGKIP